MSVDGHGAAHLLAGEGEKGGAATTRDSERKKKYEEDRGGESLVGELYAKHTRNAAASFLYELSDESSVLLLS